MNYRSPADRDARRRARLSIALSGTAFTLGLAAASAAIADPPAYADLPKSWTALANDAAVRPSENSKPDFSADIEARKSYAIPALEILGFELLLNAINRNSGNGDDYKSSLSTIRHNLHSSWVTDTDPFKTNQLGHPYQGSMYHGFARSAGLSYWESSAYTFLGSALWEIAGEKTPPSKNVSFRASSRGVSTPICLATSRKMSGRCTRSTRPL